VKQTWTPFDKKNITEKQRVVEFGKSERANDPLLLAHEPHGNHLI